MSYLYLLAAILFEVAGTTCMKVSEGFTRPGPSVGMFVLYALSLTALTLSVKRLDVSVVYAIWSGLGTALIALIGYAAFKEPMNMARVGGIVLVVAGVALIQVGTPRAPETPPGGAASSRGDPGR